MKDNIKFTSILEDDYQSISIFDREVRIDNSDGEYDAIYIDIMKLKEAIDEHLEKLYIKEDE